MSMPGTRGAKLKIQQTGVPQMERSMVAACCQDAEGGRPGTLAASDGAIITIVVSKLRGAGNNLP